jgi:Cu+-exporting ATPase
VTSATGAASEGSIATIELGVTGMTCAACAMRVEKRLNRLEGVAASVNYATEAAVVEFDPSAVGRGELVEAIRSAGYDVVPDAAVAGADGSQLSSEVDRVAAAATALDSLRRRVLVSAVLTAPALLLSMVTAFQFRNWQWLVFSMVGPVVAWGGWPFHVAAARNLRHGVATMDTLVSVGSLAAYGYSVWSLFFGHAGEPGMTMSMSWSLSRSGSHHLYLEVGASVITFVLLGRMLEARAKLRAGDALAALGRRRVEEVVVLDAQGAQHTVAIDRLQVGDRFVVRAGERIATDGVVVEGRAAVDASLVTGESLPVDVAVGDRVTGSTVNTDGRLVVRATSVGADTAVAQIARLVRDAQSGKAAIQRLADRIAAVFVPIVLALAVVTFALWWWRGDHVMAFGAAVTVLIVACPCALGLATPTALLVGTGRAAQLGIVIRGIEAIEATRSIDVVLMDKTGTLTTGEMSVVDVVTAGGAATGAERGEALRLAAALEAGSQHPIASAIVAAAAAAAAAAASAVAAAASAVAAAAAVDDFDSHAGLGVSGLVEGRPVAVGRAAWIAERVGGLPAWAERAVQDAIGVGRAVAVVEEGDPGEVAAVIAVADTVRPTSRAAIDALREMGVASVLVTGDSLAAAGAVAAAIGVDDVVAEVLPAGKVDVVHDWKRRGHVVAMVGDGINDAGALASADLGISVGTGTDVAIAASDLTIVSGDIASVPVAVALARRTRRVIVGNLFWAFAYNVAALPIAALGLLNPVIAGGAMAFSSLFVVTNSLRLANFGRR